MTFEELAADATGEPVNDVLVEEETKSEEVSVLSSAFAEQLANVQCQLMALSHLPRTIQTTLDEITKQLQTLIPPSKLKQKSVEPEIKVEEAEVTTATCEGKRFEIESVNTSRGLFFFFFSLSETQVHVEESSESTSTVEIVTHEAVTLVSEVMSTATTTVESEESNYHLSKDDIDDYEESQAKFRALWEKKREKVRNSFRLRFKCDETFPDYKSSCSFSLRCCFLKQLH